MSLDIAKELSKSSDEILIDWHPEAVARILKRAVGDREQRQIARVLRCTQQYVSMILDGKRALSPQIAARLEWIGLDGRLIYTMQERRLVELHWRCENGLLQREPFHMKQEKIKDRISHNKEVRREAAVKAARTRKRQAAARAEAEKQTEAA